MRATPIPIEYSCITLPSLAGVCARTCVVFGGVQFLLVYFEILLIMCVVLVATAKPFFHRKISCLKLSSGNYNCLCGALDKLFFAMQEVMGAICNYIVLFETVFLHARIILSTCWWNSNKSLV